MNGDNPNKFEYTIETYTPTPPSSTVSFTSIEVRYRSPGSISYDRLLQTFGTFLQLHSLSLIDCHLEQQQIRLLMGVLTNLSLVRLDISDNSFAEGKTMQYLASLLQNNTTLRELNLSKTRLSEASLNILVESLSQNTSLNYLNLSHNSMLKDRLIVMNSALLKHTGLRHLVLHDCEISNIGAEVIKTLLEYNKSIEMMDLLHNPFAHLGWKQIVAALYNNNTLKGLSLTVTSLKSLYRPQITSAMNHNLHYVNLHCATTLEPKAVEGMLSDFMKNRNLVAINLDYHMQSRNKKLFVQKVADMARNAHTTLLHLTLNNRSLSELQSILKTSHDQFEAACLAISAAKEEKAQDQNAMMQIDIKRLQSQLWYYTQVGISQDIDRHKYLEAAQKLPHVLHNTVVQSLYKESPVLYFRRIPVEITSHILAKLSEKQLITYAGGKISLPVGQK